MLVVRLQKLPQRLRGDNWARYARNVAVNFDRARKRYRSFAGLTLPIRLKEWLYERSLQRKLNDLEREWAPRLFNANREARNSQQAYAWYEGLLAEFHSHVNRNLDELHRTKTSRLLRHARRWNVEVPPEPVSGEAWAQTDVWEKSSCHGYAYLTAKAMSEISHKIRREKEEFIRLCTVPLAWLIAFVSLLVALRS